MRDGGAVWGGEEGGIPSMQNALANGEEVGYKMRDLHLWEILSTVLFYFCIVNALKCRTATEGQGNNDFEYVVRMCLRHMRNESDAFNLYRIQSDYDNSRNKRYRDEMSNDNNSNNNNNDNKNNYNRNRGNYPEGFDRFWTSNSPHDRNRHGEDDRNRHGEDDRNRQDGDYEESDYFGLPRNGKDGRKKFKVRVQQPHSYQQQLQHDRDVLYGRGNRDSYSNRNKNTKMTFNRDKTNDSPLADIDPCVIHCIFQEMQMVDGSGKPNKALISQKMSQKIRNSELKNFIQESVEECFESIDDDDMVSYYGGYNSNNNNNNNNNNNSNNRYRNQDTTCDWAKSFAMCLEERGRDNCDDWNEPFQKNHNNNNNSNNGNGKNNENQRHKSKQNDRG